MSDSSKFPEICIANKKHLNFLINIEKQIIDLIKQLSKSHVILDTEYKKLKPQGLGFGLLHAFCKIHKSLIDKCPPFWPILLSTKIRF